MAARKLLTCVVPCYNSAAYMERAVDSLLAGGEEMEVLIVDDGSTDGTGEIADRLAAAYPSVVKVHHQENGGHGSALNYGMAHAGGLYFKVVDSDDRMVKENLPGLMDLLRNHTSLETLNRKIPSGSHTWARSGRMRSGPGNKAGRFISGISS